MTITLRRSRRGVPHILFKHRGIQYSACYFGKTNVWRVWVWMPGKDQVRVGDIKLTEGEEVEIKSWLDTIYLP